MALPAQFTREPLPQDPITWISSVTPSDTTDLTSFGRGILLSADGTVVVTLRDNVDGTNQTLVLSGGVWHPLVVKRVWSTGTDGTLTIKVGG